MSLVDGFRQGFGMMSDYYNRQDTKEYRQEQLGLQNRRMNMAEESHNANMETAGLNTQILQNQVNDLPAANKYRDETRGLSLDNQKAGLDAKRMQTQVAGQNLSNAKALGGYEAEDRKRSNALERYKVYASTGRWDEFLQDPSFKGTDLELLQNTFATSFEQVTHRVTCLNDPKLPGVPFHFLRVDVAGNISKRFSLSGIEIPRYGGACPRWNVYSAFSRPGVIQAAVSKMTNGEKYVCIAKTVEKGVGRYGQKKSMLSIGLGCEAKYAKEFVYTENLDLSDKKSELPIGVSCRTCDRLDCSQRAFPPLHKKFDVDINSRGVSVYVNE